MGVANPGLPEPGPMETAARILGQNDVYTGTAIRQVPSNHALGAKLLVHREAGFAAPIYSSL